MWCECFCRCNGGGMVSVMTVGGGIDSVERVCITTSSDVVDQNNPWE